MLLVFGSTLLYILARTYSSRKPEHTVIYNSNNTDVEMRIKLMSLEIEKLRLELEVEQIKQNN